MDAELMRFGIRYFNPHQKNDARRSPHFKNKMNLAHVVNWYVVQEHRSSKEQTAN